MKIKTVFLYSLCVFVSVFSIGRLMDSNKMMIPEFTVPYFSGAALMHHAEGWQFNLSEVDTLQTLLELSDKKVSRDKINNYRFTSEKTTSRPYSINQPGYLYIVRFACKVFSWTGDIGALKLLQLSVHALISLLILLQLNHIRSRLLFFFLYVINPVIIHYALYPFYYFWEMIPSFFLVYFYLSKKQFSFLTLAGIAVFLAFMFQVRSTVLILSLLTLLYASVNQKLFQRISLLCIYILSIWLMSSKETHKHPGHIMYTSLGAYPNNYVESFSDTIPWNAFRKYKEINYSYNSKPDMYDKEVFFGESEWSLREYKKIAFSEPLMIIRNAALNYLQSFSIGHVRSSLLLSYLSSFLGLIFLLLLFLKKKFKIIIALTAASCTFCFYLAPLPIYLYGSYILLIIGFIELLNAFFPMKTK